MRASTPYPGCVDRAVSFDHLVGARQHARRHVKAERFGGLEVDHQLVLGRRLHRQVGRLLALEDAIDVAGGSPVLVGEIRPVGDQAAVRDEKPVGIDRGQPMPGRQRNDQIAMKCRRTRSPSRSGRHSAVRANAAMARSISPASRTLTGLNSTPNDGATDLDRAELPDPRDVAQDPEGPPRASCPARSALSSSSHFPLMPYSNVVKPVVLPPGRARLSTKPAPTGSMTARTRSARCGSPASNGRHDRRAVPAR